jgi:hypothetical protein
MPGCKLVSVALAFAIALSATARPALVEVLKEEPVMAS